MSRPLRIEYTGAISHEYVRLGMELPLRAPGATPWRGLALGREAFLETVRQRLALAEADPDIPRSRQMRQRSPLGRAIEHLADALGADPSSWSSGRRIDSEHRATAAYAARRLLGYRRGEVAQALGSRSPSSVAHAERRLEPSGHLRRLARKTAAQVASP